MSFISTKSRYHIALNGVGLMLQGAPDRLAYTQGQAPIYGNRFAQGDRTYADFTFWWYWTQTNWAAGYKQDKRWQDDATFLDSNGVNVELKPSSIILSPTQTHASAVSGRAMVFTDYVETNRGVLVGRNTTSGKMISVNADDGSVIFEGTATGANEQINCAASIEGTNYYMGCMTTGGSTSLLRTQDGTPIGTHSTGNGIYGLVYYRDGDKFFFFNDGVGLESYDHSSSAYSTLKSTFPMEVLIPSLSVTNLKGHGAVIIGARIYFTIKLAATNSSQLWAYDIGNNAWVPIWTFGAGARPIQLVEYNSNLYLFDNNTITGRLSLWKYSPSISTVQTVGSMVRIKEFGRYGDSTQIIGNPCRDFSGIYFTVNNGSTNQIWQLNENDYVFGGVTPPAKYASVLNGMMLSMTGAGNLTCSLDGAIGTSSIDQYVAVPATTFQTTGYVTSSVFDGNIPGIDKLFYNLVLNFDALIAGQSLEVQYSIDQGKTFTSMGTADFAIDGGISSKDFFWSGSLITKYIVIKLILNGNGSNTPSINDFSVKYIPFINYTKQWSLNIDCGDEVKGLDGVVVGRPGRELKAMLEAAWWAKSVLDFQDLDYASAKLTANVAVGDTTITVDNTQDFPEQGRIRIDSEEMLYTNKTSTTFTGVTRGARETRITAHTTPATVSNAYRVIVTELGVKVPISLEDKRLEYSVQLQLREV